MCKYGGIFHDDFNTNSLLTHGKRILKIGWHLAKLWATATLSDSVANDLVFLYRPIQIPVHSEG